MTTLPQSSREKVIDHVRNYRPGRHMNPVPGLPVSHVPIQDGPVVRALLAEGVLRLVEVEKPSKVDPSKTVTYAYLVAV